MSEELSVRDELEAAMKAQAPEEIAEPAEPEVTAEPEKPDEGTRERDEKGRFVAKAEQAEPDTGTEVAEKPEVEAKPEGEVEPAETAETPAPPNGWTAEAKAKWHELPEDVQAAVAQREADIAKFTSTRDEHASFGKQMYQAVQPYMPQIQAEGGTPASAVQSLLNTAYVLRTGTPEKKRELLLQTAQQFGVDLTGVSQQEQQNVPPYVQELNQRFQRLESTLTQQQQAAQQQIQSEAHQEIDTFAADPANAHFEEVKGHMAALLRDGAAKDLQDAYEQACWANPSVRATLQAQERAAEEQKRRQETKRKADEAKRKAVSITGGPGNTAGGPAPGESRSIREELEANWAASSGGV